MGEHGLIDHYDAKQERYYSSDRPDMRAKIPATVRSVLDVGCGRGDFGHNLKKERPGLYVAGIELTDWAQEARKQLDAVYQIDAEKGDLSSIGTFDCITFNDVLEHLFDPAAVVRNLAKALAPGGVMIASSPNLRYFYTMHNLLVNKRFDYTPSGPMDFTHIRFFTGATFNELFSQAGLQVVDSGGLAADGLSAKFRLLNFVFGGALDDMRYLQIFVIAKKPA